MADEAILNTRMMFEIGLTRNFHKNSNLYSAKTMELLDDLKSQFRRAQEKRLPFIPKLEVRVIQLKIGKFLTNA